MTAITPELFKVYEEAVQTECERLGWHVQPQGMGTYTPDIAKTLGGKTGLAAHFPRIAIENKIENNASIHRSNSPSE